METIEVPWADKHSRHTLLFERFVLQVLKACRCVSAAGRLVGLSWDQLHRIMERAVGRGMDVRNLEKFKHAGLDEKSFAKGQSDVSILSDLDESRVIEVMEARDQEAAGMLFETLPREVLDRIEAVCIDMSGSYRATVEASLPNAAIVHDRFHISAHLNEAVAKVHKEENARLQRVGDNRLKGTQRLFGFDPDNFKEEQVVRFND